MNAANPSIEASDFRGRAQPRRGAAVADHRLTGANWIAEYQLASTNWIVDASAFSEILEGEREAALGRIRALSIEFDDIVAASADSNNDDEHDPEGSTVAFERVRTATLLDEARACLAALELAEARLVAGTFSECECCGAQIAPDRLAARPVARTCITCATETPRTGGFR